MSNRIMKMERRLGEAAEVDALYLRRAVESPACQLRPYFRPATLKWDWLCPCGNLVWAPKSSCPMCSMPRRYGTTAVGSTRGSMPSSAMAVKAREQQRFVLGFGASQPHQLTSPAADAAVKHHSVGGGYAWALGKGTWADVVRSIANGNAPTAVTTPVVPLAPAHALIADNEVNENDEMFDGSNMTVPEDLDYDSIRRLLVRHRRVLQRRMERHANEVKRSRGTAAADCQAPGRAGGAAGHGRRDRGSDSRAQGHDRDIVRSASRFGR